MSRPKFRWTQGRLESICPAAKFGSWLIALPNQNPNTIVAEAANRRSPAHKFFQWDDSLAAQEHRLLQARLLLGSFCIETEVTSKGRKARWIDVPFVTRSQPGLYEVTTLAMRESGKRDFIVAEALRQANRWRRRFANLSELAVIFAAMDEVESRTVRRKKGSGR